ELGLANHLSEDPVADAVAAARKMSRMPRQALEATKRLLNIHMERAVMATLDYGNTAEAQSFEAEDFRNIVAGLHARRNRLRFRRASRRGASGRAPNRLGQRARE